MPHLSEGGRDQVHGVQGGLLLLQALPEATLERAQVRLQETSVQGSPCCREQWYSVQAGAQTFIHQNFMNK